MKHKSISEIKKELMSEGDTYESAWFEKGWDSRDKLDHEVLEVAIEALRQLSYYSNDTETRIDASSVLDVIEDLRKKHN